MIILLFFAFLAGIVTILSPCILPVLPVVLSGTMSEGKRRPLGIIVGFIISFTLFTLFLSTIVRLTGIPVDSIRVIAIILIALFGISLLIPAFQTWIEMLFARIASAHGTPKTNQGFTGGLIMGITIGLVWAPCVGPILASVIALALTGTVTATTFAITLAYSIGTAIPMFAVLTGGRSVVGKIKNPAAIQRGFGVIMIVVSVGMFLNLDRKFETWILTAFPNYGTGLTKIEENPMVSSAIAALHGKPADQSQIGKPTTDMMLPEIGTAPEITGGQQWFNLPPGVQSLTLQNLRGKVVMIDFWTYTCINCIRTLPYTKMWWNKYKDKGFVLIGVHTPEFTFEQSAYNVSLAIRDFGITYPVVQDNNYTIWNAYQNQYWPADYLIDKNGKIRDTHFGEGDYDTTEANIVKLLNETGENLSSANIHNQTYTVSTNTPETYLGLARLGALASPEPPVANTPTVFTIPSTIPYNTFAYGGTWTLAAQAASPATGAELDYHFEATDVYLVMSPKMPSTPGKIQVLLDGKVVSAANAGDDVVNGIVTVNADRLYKLIKLPAMGEHTLQLKLLDDGLELYAFTFG